MSESLTPVSAPAVAAPPPVPPGPVDLCGMDQAGIRTFMAGLGEKTFRADQLYKWIHQRGATEFDDMTDLSKDLRAKLKERCVLLPLKKDLEQRSKDGTIKYRWRTHDNRFIESVYMPSEDRKTLCVSTQVGCAMGCTFCMTGTLGLIRNLTAGEIVAQIHAVNREVRKNENLELTRPLTNLVFMGMGEPLHNFNNLKKAIQILQSEAGPNFSRRHITVSTVGLVPMIEKLGAETDVKLAISLNASSDEQRSNTMPINKRWNIAALMEAVRKFPVKHHNRVTFEYVLLSGVNDTDADAARLIDLLKDLRAKVNLIPYNENPGLGFHTTQENRAEDFRLKLINAGIAAFIRKNRGRDIDAACGQLANQERGPAQPADVLTCDLP